MNTRNRHFRNWIAAAFVAAAVAAPAALANGPDDRALYRGTSQALAPASQSPDDRALYRGTSDSLVPSTLTPDDRPLSRSVGEIEPRTTPVVISAPARGFAWEDAAIGGSFGLTLALLGGGVILIAHRRRGTLGTA